MSLLGLLLVGGVILWVCCRWEEDLDERALAQGRLRVWRRGRVATVPIRRTCRPAPPNPPDPEPPVIHPPENKPYPWRPWS